MPAQVAQIYIASHTLRELIVVDKPYSLVGTIFIVCGLLFLLIGYGSLLFVRMSVSRPLQALIWLLPLVVGLPFLAIGLNSATGVARVTVSADQGALRVNRTILSVPVRSRVYPLDEVRSVQVGVGDVCRFLYANLADGRSETLLGCTDRTGYSEVADSINGFLAANRR
jgi:hypothetical protein